MKAALYVVIVAMVSLGALTSCDKDTRIYAKELKAERLLVEDYIERNGLKIVETMPSEAAFQQNPKLYYHSTSGLYYRLERPGRTDLDSIQSGDKLTIDMRYLEYTLTERADTADYWSPEVYPAWQQFTYGSSSTNMPNGFLEAVSYMRRTESEAKLIVTSKLGFDASVVTPYGYHVKIRFAKNKIPE